MNRPAVIALVFIALFVGCGKKYMTPGAGVDMSMISDRSIRSAMETKPAASFPVTVAIVRVQARGYRSYSNACYGRGQFCIVTTRDIESLEHLARLDNLPQVAAMVPLNRMILPRIVESSKDLRKGAASLKADMVLMYSIDTTFWIDKTNIGPLSAMTLGFAPKNRAYVSSTAAAVILDTRTGFVYGLAEGSARDDKIANSWNKQASVEKARLKTEAQAFDSLVDQLVTLWDEILIEHGGKNPQDN